MRFKKTAASEEAIRHRKTLQYYDSIGALVEWDWITTFTFGHAHAPGRAFAEVEAWLERVERATEGRIGWAMAQARGEFDGRLHVHLLVTGVSRLNFDFWIRDAKERFGDCELQCLDYPAAYYLAKNGLAETADFIFGGKLSGLDPAIIGALRRRGFRWPEIARVCGAGVGTVKRVYNVWLNRPRREQQQHG